MSPGGDMSPKLKTGALGGEDPKVGKAGRMCTYNLEGVMPLEDDDVLLSSFIRLDSRLEPLVSSCRRWLC